MYPDDDSNCCRGGLPVQPVGGARPWIRAVLVLARRARRSQRPGPRQWLPGCAACWRLPCKAQPAPALEWIVATVEGNTYRATQVRELPDGSVQIQVRSGRQVTVPASRLAKVWPDTDSQRNQPAELTVRTTCVRSQLEGRSSATWSFGADRVAHSRPHRAPRSGQSLYFQRQESATTEARAWADVEEIRRPPGLLDPCRVAPPTPEPVWQPSPGSPHRPTSRGESG